MIDIGIVDDHKIFVETLNFFLSKNENIQVVGTATSGLEALKLIAETDINVLILDIHMPGMDGEEILEEIKKKDPRVKILVLSMSSSSKDVQRMLRSGADGYILKEKGGEELIGAIHQVMGGQRYVSLDLIDKIIPGPGAVVKAKITPRELEVLKLAAKGLKDKEIADKLDISNLTVSKHMYNLRKKTGTNNRVELINWARENGLLNDNDEES